MQTFWQIVAMTGYSIFTWFVINDFIKAMKAAIAKDGFSRRAFIVGFIALTIGGALYAFNTSAAMEACSKRHSAATCKNNIK
jgi:hypothetical protein